jgi:hypothetical protein
MFGPHFDDLSDPMLPSLPSSLPPQVLDRLILMLSCHMALLQRLIDNLSLLDLMLAFAEAAMDGPKGQTPRCECVVVWRRLNDILGLEKMLSEPPLENKGLQGSRDIGLGRQEGLLGAKRRARALLGAATAKT